MEVVHYYKEAYTIKEFTLHTLLFEVEDEFFEAHVYEDSEITYVHSCRIEPSKEINIPFYFKEKSYKVFHMLYETIEEDY